MTFGEDWGWGSSEEDSHEILSRFMELGGNFVDTANMYTKGHSEKIIGDFLRHKARRRDQLVIATKFFGSMFTGDPNAGGASRKSIFAACENSLRRLQTDYIDLYWMHCWDRFTPIEETMGALQDLVCQGKIRYIGFSDTPAWKCAQAQLISKFRGWAPLIALQIEYSLLERTVEGELIPMAMELGLGVTPWSPLKQGALSGKYTRANVGKHDAARGEWVIAALTEKAYDIVDELVRISKRTGSTPSAVALSWLQQKPGVTSTIIGARTLKQLEDNISALELEIPVTDLERLDELSKPVLNFPADFLNLSLSFGFGGTTINGETAEPFALAPSSDEEKVRAASVR
jgi:aryl-alcohol dehydrogenase-like predicted oxidoreductase